LERSTKVWTKEITGETDGVGAVVRLCGRESRGKFVAEKKGASSALGEARTRLIFLAGSEIQGGVGNELEIVTYGLSGKVGSVGMGEKK
jgi:hypothetical protein